MKERGINRDVVKYIAMFTMLLNHIAHIQLLPLPAGVYEAFQDIGYFTAPAMCFFLVEGFYYTSSRKQYGLRLLLFAIVSQIPYELVFHNGTLNMIFTLFLCFLILTAMERIPDAGVCRVVCMLLVLASGIGDWAFFAPLLTILLYRSAGDRKQMAFSYGLICLLFVLLNMVSYRTLEPEAPAGEIVWRGAASGLGVLTAGFTVLVLYNGKRTQRGANFAKWFFYLFYPLHLLILYLLKTFVLVW